MIRTVFDSTFLRMVRRSGDSRSLNEILREEKSRLNGRRAFEITSVYGKTDRSEIAQERLNGKSGGRF